MLPDSAGPYIALMLAGFAVAAFGHLGRWRWVATIGIIMVFLATLLFPLAANVFEDDRPATPPQFAGDKK